MIASLSQNRTESKQLLKMFDKRYYPRKDIETKDNFDIPKSQQTPGWLNDSLKAVKLALSQPTKLKNGIDITTLFAEF